MRKVVELNLFQGFFIGRDPVVISPLQYADDTLYIGEATVENLWTLKAILRGFELVSGLKFNFWKSGLMGVNVSPTFLTMASTFLNYAGESVEASGAYSKRRNGDTRTPSGIPGPRWV
ncbi:retrovirus-related pol polyprotein LINE-1 [Trifolium medium]|uniref:Retrovirus-related pol polyprotein LINE-1 n=1 Tax=Trifolium medium TaxID=97028 RepID=A0A392MSN5_9FABA|nr:retrovirus-related pol polyprotein LINE-1 [Trifolium medium]